MDYDEIEGFIEESKKYYEKQIRLKLIKILEKDAKCTRIKLIRARKHAAYKLINFLNKLESPL